jgi:hypothetical protein
MRPSALEKKYLNLTDNDFLMRAEQIAYLVNGHIFEYSIANHIHPRTLNFLMQLFRNILINGDFQFFHCQVRNFG